MSSARMDMGVIVHPDGATMQVEGCITMGLGYVFAEEVRIRDGKVLDENFDSYELPASRGSRRSRRSSSRTTPSPRRGAVSRRSSPMGAAIANAVYDATGARLFRLPMTAARVKAALEQGKGR